MMQHFSMSSFVAGSMLGILLTGAWFLGGNSALRSFSTSPAPTTLNTERSAPESGTISVTNQPPGSSVIVESVTVPPPGVWVAVREVNDSDLGNVLGAARVSGPRAAISVPLLRATEPNRPYAIQLYRDDGDGGFDPARNSVYVDFDTGARAVAYFTTTE